VKLLYRINLRMGPLDRMDFEKAYSDWRKKRCTHASVQADCAAHSKARFARILVRCALNDLALEGADVLDQADEEVTR